MNIYGNYLSTISEAIGRDKRSNRINKGLSGIERSLHEALDTHAFFEKKVDMTPLPSFLNLVNTAGLKANVDQKLGEHPHFKHLKETNQTEKHYIVSVFIDIKGSTNLFKEYDLETIAIITILI